MAYIYKITNIKNNKVYIGQTTYSLEERFKLHLQEAFAQKSNRPLYKAMRKYGAENFIIECIEEVSLADINNKEIYYIEFYKSYAPLGFGYNATLGGEGTRTLDYQLIYALWDSGLSIAEICKIVNANRYGVRHALQGYAKYSEQEARHRGNIYQHSLRKKKVYQYNENGDFINEFSTVEDAAKTLNCRVKSIQAALANSRSAAVGYLWSYYKFNRVEPLDYKVRKYKQIVYEITADSRVIAEYESASAAAKSLNLNDSYIRLACNKKTNKYPKLNRYFCYKEQIIK